MTMDSEHDLDVVLEQAQQFMSALEDQKHRMNTQSFTGTDETGTVHVVVNERCWLTDLRIEHGLLRLGAQTVQQRFTEALHIARAEATAAAEDELRQLEETLSSISGALQQQFGELAPQSQ
jgi:DNA-binding protein YbaB